MIQYKHNRFYIGEISFMLPDEIYIKNDPDFIFENGLMLISSDQTHKIELRFEEGRLNSADELQRTRLRGMKIQIIEPIETITHNGLSVYAVTYRLSDEEIYEVRFDLYDAAQFTFLVSCPPGAGIQKFKNAPDVLTLFESIQAKFIDTYKASNND